MLPGVNLHYNQKLPQLHLHQQETGLFGNLWSCPLSFILVYMYIYIYINGFHLGIEMAVGATAGHQQCVCGMVSGNGFWIFFLFVLVFFVVLTEAAHSKFLQKLNARHIKI